MDTRLFFSLSVSIFFMLWLPACGSVQSEIQDLPPIPTAYSTLTPGATSTPPLTTPTSTLICNNDLQFMSDLTIPDETIISPGTLINKQWLIQNTGSCNWDDRYRLRLINGVALSASEQSLFPARSGAQVSLQIEFIAPLQAGSFISEWRAFDPDSIPFGDSFYIKIYVQH